MNEYLPIEIRHLDKTIQPLSSTDVLPIVIGSNSEGYETRKVEVYDILQYVNSQNQEINLRTLSVYNSAYIANALAIGNTVPDTDTKLYVDGNVVISGSLSSLGTSTVFNTQYISTTSLELKAAGGPSLVVDQDFEHPVAQFFDGGTISLHIDGSSERPGYVGINTTTPNTHLTVLGNISARDNTYTNNLSSDNSYLKRLSANVLVVNNEAYIGTNGLKTTVIGNISGGIVNLNGNVGINVSSLSSTQTQIGNDLSNTYVNGSLFVNNLSGYGNILFNTLSGQTKEFTVGNIDSINTLLGTNILSGYNYLKGPTYINSSENSNTYLHTNDSAGNLEIGNLTNQIIIKSGNLSLNNTITSEIFRYDFTDYDLLTSTMDEVFSTFTIVYSSLTVGAFLTSASSFAYSVLQPINGLSVDLNNQTLLLGDTYTEIETKANNFNLNSTKTISLCTSPGGVISLGTADAVITLNAYELNLNNDDGFGMSKNTNINTLNNSGNVYIGNPSGILELNGETYINALSSSVDRTVIGSVSSEVDIYNINVLGRGLILADLIVDRLVVRNFLNLVNGFESSQTCSISGDLNLRDRLILQSGLIEGNAIASGIVSGTNLNINGWDTVYSEFQISSAAWGTGGVAQQLAFDPSTNSLSQSYGNSVSLTPLLYAAVAMTSSSFVSISGADVSTSNFVLSGGVGIVGELNQGNLVLASGDFAHAEGYKTTASANYSHTEGYLTTVGKKINFDYYFYGTNTFIFSPSNVGHLVHLNPGDKIRIYEGDNVNDIFIAEVVNVDLSAGSLTVSKDFIGRNSSNGYFIDNSGVYGHAEGYNTYVTAENSHAEGRNSEVHGKDSHASGVDARTNFERTWVWQGSPDGTIFDTTKNDQFAVKAASGVYIVGNVGINTDNDLNALTINGNISSNGDLYIDKNASILGNLLVYGGLSALGDISVIETQIGVTSALEITNIGSGPALKVSQAGPNNTAEFYNDADPVLVLANNVRVGIGISTPSTTLHLSGTDALVIPVGTTSQRIPVKGAIRYNSDDSTFEGYDGSNWGSLGGVKDIDQNTYISAEDYPGANNNQLKFVTNGTEKAIIQPNGLFGIGTSVPNEALTVSGNISSNGNIFIQSLTAFGDAKFETTLEVGAGNTVLFASNDKVGINSKTPATELTVNGSISSNKDIFTQSLTAFEDSKFNKNLHVNNDLTVSNVFNLSAVTFTGEIYTNVTSITAQNEFIKVIANGQTKYIRLYDIE